MRKILSAVLVLVMLVTLMVPCAMAAEAGTEPASTEKSSMNASGGGFTDKLLSAGAAEAEAEPAESNLVANIVVFALLAVVVGVSVAMVIDKKRKLYK